MSMIGKTLSHYEISSKIGAGGMGEVLRRPLPSRGKAQKRMLEQG